MDIYLERDGNVIGSLFQQIIGDLKVRFFFYLLFFAVFVFAALQLFSRLFSSGFLFILCLSLKLGTRIDFISSIRFFVQSIWLLPYD